MCPREIEIRCGDPNFFPRIFGAYTRIDNETEGFPVYHHKNPEIDGAIWYKSKIGWLIGPKCDIGSNYCYAYADMDGRAAPLLESNNYHWRDTLTTSTIRIQLFEIMSERCSNHHLPEQTLSKCNPQVRNEMNSKTDAEEGEVDIYLSSSSSLHQFVLYIPYSCI